MAVVSLKMFRLNMKVEAALPPSPKKKVCFPLFKAKNVRIYKHSTKYNMIQKNTWVIKGVLVQNPARGGARICPEKASQVRKGRCREAAI